MVETARDSFSRAAFSASCGACEGLRMVAKTLWPARPNASAASNPIPLLVPVISTDAILISSGREPGGLRLPAQSLKAHIAKHCIGIGRRMVGKWPIEYPYNEKSSMPESRQFRIAKLAAEVSA